MNYCSLKDAWSNNDYISSQFKEYMNPYLVEKFTNEESSPKSEKNIKEERICTNIISWLCISGNSFNYCKY